jgi:WD40 repeat protein
LELEKQYGDLEQILMKDYYAIDKPFLKERIAQTSKYLSEAIQELTRPKTTALTKPASNAKSTSIIQAMPTPDSEITPKNNTGKTINFDKASSSRKPSILKSSKYGSARRPSLESRNVNIRLQLDPEVRDQDYVFDSCDEDSVQRESKVKIAEPPKLVKKQLEIQEPTQKQVVNNHGAVDPKKTAAVSKPVYEPRPVTDVFLNNRISKPAVWLTESLILGSDITPTCLAVLSATEVVVGTSGGLLIVSDFKTTRRIKISDSPVIGLKTRGRLVAVCLDSAAHNLCLVDVEYPEDTMFMQGHSRPVSDVAWSEYGDQFVSVGKDGKLNLWKWDPLTLLKTVKVSNLPLNSVTCLAKSDLVAVGGEEATIKVFSIAQGDLQYKNTLQDSSSIVKLDSFYQNTKFVASANLLGELKIWDVTSGE